MSPKPIQCKTCKRMLSSKHQQVMEIPSDAGGVTVLGRQIPMAVKCHVGSCQHCGEKQLLGVELQLDPDVHVLRAYEEMFGPADEAARTFLAKLVTMLVGEFGDDWEQQCTDWKRLIYETVVDVKAEYGETWASLLSQAEWERPSFAIHVAKERGRT